MFHWTAEPMTAQGPRKGEPLLTFYAERFPNPTRASSPRQLPTDHDHAVPTREYQSDQSSRMLLGCRRPCCPKGPRGTKPTVSFPFGIPILPSTATAAERRSGQNRKKLKAHQQERVPAPPPVDVSVDARTVLQSRVRFAAPQTGAPLTAPRRSGRNVIATGGSGGNTSQVAPPRQKRRPPSCGGKPA
jgi:hypothetical protein